MFCSYKRLTVRLIFRCLQRLNPYFTQILPKGWRFYLIESTLKHHCWYACKQLLSRTTKTCFIYQSVSIFLSLQSLRLNMTLFYPVGLVGGYAAWRGVVTVGGGAETIIRWKLCPCDSQSAWGLISAVAAVFLQFRLHN